MSDEGKYEPPLIYDEGLDRWRAVRQADVDRLLQISGHYGRAIMAVKAVVQDADFLAAKLVDA